MHMVNSIIFFIFLCFYNIYVHNYSMHNNKRTSAQIEQQIVSSYIDERKSCIDVAKQYGVCHQTVINVLRRNGHDVRVDRRRIGINDDVLMEHPNELLPYFVGLMMSDGNIHGNHGIYNVFSIGIHERDKDILHNLKARFGSEHKIRLRNDGIVRWRVTSQRIVDTLQEYGVAPNKTFTAKAKNGMQLNRHFWRGMIDGDGSLGIYNGLPRIHLCGASIHLIQQWQSYVKKLLPKNQVSILEPEDHFYTFDIGGRKQAKILARHLYGDCCVALNRKLQLAKRIMEL